jgi:hypothetical protein
VIAADGRRRGRPAGGMDVSAPCQAVDQTHSAQVVREGERLVRKNLLLRSKYWLVFGRTYY